MAAFGHTADRHMPNLFDPLYESEKLHQSFLHLLDPRSEPARAMVQDVFTSFEDADGNFVEQFQTSGFDARFFELYLYAYFSRSGFKVHRPRPNPDFLVSRAGLEVAVEATTVNPSTSGVLADIGKKIAGLDEAGIMEYIRDELPIRFGSPLASKNAEALLGTPAVCW
jgi:hypothetical protein